MKRALTIIAAFVAITIALTWFWEETGRAEYGRFLRTVAPSIYDAIGFGDARVGALRQRYINWIPFVGLVLVTPRLSPKRRVIGLLAGLFAIFLAHLGLNLTELLQNEGHLPVVPSLLSDTLPFLLWIVVAFPVIGEWFGVALGATEPDTDTDGGPEGDVEESTNPLPSSD